MKRAVLIAFAYDVPVNGYVVHRMSWGAEISERHGDNVRIRGMLRTDYDVDDLGSLNPKPVKLWNSKEEAEIDLTIRGFEVLGDSTLPL